MTIEAIVASQEEHRKLKQLCVERDQEFEVLDQETINVAVEDDRLDAFTDLMDDHDFAWRLI